MFVNCSQLMTIAYSLYENCLQIVVNAPFWLYTSQVLFSRFMNQGNKKKFILARPQRVTPILLR